LKAVNKKRKTHRKRACHKEESEGGDANRKVYRGVENRRKSNPEAQATFGGETRGKSCGQRENKEGGRGVLLLEEAEGKPRLPTEAG